MLWHLGFSSLTGIEPAPSALEAWSQPLGHQGSPESKDRQTNQETLVGQRWPSTHLRVGTGTTVLSSTPTALLVPACDCTLCVLGERRVRRELRGDWIPPPVRKTLVPEERLTGEGTAQSSPMARPMSPRTEIRRQRNRSELGGEGLTMLGVK